MSFNLDNYVKLPPWLQMVGVIGLFIALGHLPSGSLWLHLGWLRLTWRGCAYVAAGMAVAGRLFNFVYP